MQNVTIAGIPVYQAMLGDAECGVLRISLVDDPAVMSNFVAFDNQKQMQLYAVQDEEKRLVLGVVMRCDFPIYRRSAEMGEYYIMFKADTIREMAEKYLVENRQNLVNLMHRQGSEVEGVNMVQYFIKGDGLAPAGFEEISDGSLFAEFHVNNDEVWDAIKAGTYMGFSLEGLFDLVPETDKGYVAGAVGELDGKFNKTHKLSTKMKLKGLMARIAKVIADFGNVTTDKGIIAWDGDGDLEAGVDVFIENEDGNRTPAPDGDYRTDDKKIIVVVDGKVSEIKDDEAEISDGGDGNEDFGSVQTDKGGLEWDGNEDLKAGDAVYVRDENGERVAAPDGDYVSEDGKVIVVADGKVSEIRDDKAQVGDENVEARKEAALARIHKFSESYDEKRKKIYEAVMALLGENAEFYLADAGDDFAVADVFDIDAWESHHERFSISWNEDGSAVASDPVEVKLMFVPMDFADPFAGAPAQEDEEMAKLRKENDDLRKQVAELSAQPKGQPAHTEMLSGASTISTGNKGLDRLAKIVKA